MPCGSGGAIQAGLRAEGRPFRDPCRCRVRFLPAGRARITPSVCHPLPSWVGGGGVRPSSRRIAGRMWRATCHAGKRVDRCRLVEVAEHPIPDAVQTFRTRTGSGLVDVRRLPPSAAGGNHHPCARILLVTSLPSSRRTNAGGIDPAAGGPRWKSGCPSSTNSRCCRSSVCTSWPVRRVPSSGWCRPSIQ